MFEGQKYINMLLSYRDMWGLIVQKDKDGGDCSQRTGLYYSLLKLAGIVLTDRFEPIEEGYEHDMQMLEVSPGVFHRHPDPWKWYSDPNNFSRDQQVVLMGAMIMMNDERRLEDIINRLKERKYFHQNIVDNGVVVGSPEYRLKTADFITPMEASLIIRSKFKLSFLDKIKLTLLDSFMLLDNYLAKKNGWDAYNMVCILHMICNRVHPTFMSKLGWRMVDKDLARKQIRRYYSENGINGIFPLGELYCMVIDQESGGI